MEWLLLAGVLGGLLLPAWLAGLGAAALFVLIPRRMAAAVALAALAAFAAVEISHRQMERTFVAVLDGHDRGGGAVVRVDDPGLTAAPGFGQDSLISAKVRQIRLAGERDWTPVSGKVLLRLPFGSQYRLRYGEVLTASGRFELPEPGSSFANYLASRRIGAVLQMLEFKSDGVEAGIFGRLLACRDRLLARAAGSIEPPRIRNAIASLYFACKTGPDPVSRRDLIRSGTVHIYAVSGLHVGMLAVLLVLALRPLPFRLRYLILPVPLALYVLTTGANVPAARAFLMIAAWSILRAMLYRVPPVTFLVYGCVFFLLLNPANLNDPGFRYTFVITGALLLLAENYRNRSDLALDPVPMMPPGRETERLRRKLIWRNRLFFGLVSCTVAFLAGAAITLDFQQSFLPGSIVANILLLPVVALLFPMLAVKILASFVPWFDTLAGITLAALFGVIDAVAALAATLFPASATGPMPAWGIILLYTGLLLLLFPGWKRLPHRRLAGALMIAGVIAYLHIRMLCASPAALIAYGGRAEIPAVAIADPAAGVGVVINVPDGAAAAAIADFLRQHGIAKVDRVVFSEARSGAVGNLRALLRLLPVDNVVLPPPGRGDFQFRAKLIEILGENPGLGFTANPGNIKILGEKEQWTLAYFNPATTVEYRFSFAGAEVEITTPQRSTVQKLIPVNRLETFIDEYR
ncbi:MAG: ComEC/Rec2 family competence protein [Victivallaceae bacterium]